MTDALGKRVPHHLRPAFLGRPAVIEIANRIAHQNNALNLASSDVRAGIDSWLVHTALQAVRAHILNRLPFAVCFLCEERGEYSTDCHCKGRGWLNKDELDEALYAVGGCEEILPKLGMRRFQIKTRNKRHCKRRSPQLPTDTQSQEPGDAQDSPLGCAADDAGRTD